MNIKYLLMFCLGAIAGSVFTAKILDEKYSKIADEEIESVKEVTKKTIENLKKKFSESKKISEEKTEKTKYHDITKEYTEEKDAPNIEIISDNQYSDDENEKMTLWFYGVDKALLDDNEQPIENVEDCVGRDIINNPEKYFRVSSIESSHENKNTIYLRNHSMGIDFEIIYIDKSYSRDILGLEE